MTVDVFHAVKLANACVDDVRRRVQRETPGTGDRTTIRCSAIRRLFTRGYERLWATVSSSGSTRPCDAGDPFDEVGGAWAVKEQLRTMYAAPLRARPAPRTRSVFYELAATAGTPEVVRLAKTIKRWEPQVLTFFTTGRTNARSEAQNLVTEKLRRMAHGIRNFEHYRLRLLLHSGVEWDTRPTARIRGRHPRLRRVEPLVW